MALDLQDTLNAHLLECVGLAANMIGVKKRAIVIRMGSENLVLFNPVLLEKKSLTKQRKDVCPWWGVGRPLVMRRFQWPIEM